MFIMKKNLGETCRSCAIIRTFIILVICIVVFGILFSDKLHHLSFVTPWSVAYLILIFGTISFIIKLLIYKLKKNKLPISNKSDKIRD